MPQNIYEFSRVPLLKEVRDKIQNLKAIFFDLDGTILNTEPLHAKALEYMLIEKECLGFLNIDNLQNDFAGMTDTYVYLYLKENHPLFPYTDVETFLDDKNKAFLYCLTNFDLELPMSLIHLFDELKKSDLKVALVTSAEKAVVGPILKNLELESLFSFILTREDTVKNKPHPEPYLTAMEHFMLEGESVLIFEDSIVGLESATRSGCHVGKVLWYD